MNIPLTVSQRIVIIGAGFAGISLAKKLSKTDTQIVLIDKHNYHNFQPLMYQVATGGLDAGSIAYPIRKIFQSYQNFYFRMAAVQYIDTDNQKIHTDIGELFYDYLIIATGSKTNFFGNKEMERNAMSMKTIPQTLNIRSLILENFEQAVLAHSESDQNSLMNFVLVGAGPTGVELAGSLAEMKKAILQKDYPDLDISKMKINLIQGGDRILNTMSEKSSADAEGFLRKLGVTIWKNVKVTNYDGRIVTTDTETTFDAATLIWTAGVEGAPVKGLPATSYIDNVKRIKVNEYNQVEGYENIFAIGDIAFMSNSKYPQGHPMMAQPAIQQGALLAKNLKNSMSGKPLVPFVYKDKGSMATIGRNLAVVDLPKHQFSGVFAWFLWVFVHLFSIIGFRNRTVILFNWMYSYIRLDKETRLIIRPFKKKFTAFTSDEL
jgi:NADH dehydrogenase